MSDIEKENDASPNRFGRIFLRVIGFLIGLAALDQLAGFGMEALASKVRTGAQTGGLVRAALEHRDADIFVFGTSRARHHIVPSILDNRLGTTTWNAGCDGQTVSYQMMLESLLFDAGTSAKLFILTPEPMDFVEANQHAMVMAPWAFQNDEVDAVLFALSPFERVKLLSRSYRYNSQLLPVIRNLIKPDGDLSQNGFVPMRGVMPEETRVVQTPLPGTFETLSNRENAEMDYRLFLRRARQHGIPVLMTIGPRYWPEGSGEDTVREQIIARLVTLAAEEGATFTRLDEISHPQLSDPELLHDRVHLNGDGADRFSRVLAEEIARLHPSLVMLAEDPG